MDLRYDDRVAVVTGAGRGLGRAHALLLADRGAAVLVNDVGGPVDPNETNTDPAQGVVDEIVARGGRALADQTSVTSPAGGQAIIEKAIDEFGRVDIVVNNAGFLRDRAFHNLSPDEVNEVIEVHLKGAFWVSQPAWRHMRDQRYGRVICTSSAAGLFGNFGQANYGAAKMGLVGLVHVLAVEGARHNINVNAIAPIARTRMTQDVLGPIAERLDPELVSPLVGWLAHEECTTSGRIYTVGGGRIARLFVGMTQGKTWRASDLSPESVRDGFEEIEKLESWLLPKGIGDEMRVLRDALQ